MTPEELDVHFVKYHPERLMAPPDTFQIPLFCLLCPKVFPEWALAQHIKSEHWGRSVILGTFFKNKANFVNLGSPELHMGVQKGVFRCCTVYFSGKNSLSGLVLSAV